MRVLSAANRGQYLGPFSLENKYGMHYLRAHPSQHLVIRFLESIQGSHRLEKYLNLEDFLEKSLKIKSALKSTGKSLKSLEKSLNYFIFCRT